MDFLDRDQYNEKIKELNKNSDAQTSEMKELVVLYDNLFCNLSDYEEIVMLINVCIAEDRENNLEELYENYSKLKSMIDNHGDYAMEEYDMILYCMGVFSFKFHDYKAAIDYFRKCGEEILHNFSDPYISKKSDIYIKSKILMSYSLEYDGYLNEGPKKAIDNILDSSLVTTEEQEEQIIKEINKKPKEIISDFFKKYPSKIYSNANELMKKEILHMLAHCFSEYANNLKMETYSSVKYKKIYLWEKIAESFIDEIGPEMATCKAIILSEHGQYWSALENMKQQYLSLCEEEKKKKAELAFYIYYFSNQIGMDQSVEIENYKKYFLDFAEEEDGDTKVYAWIVQFREKLAKALKVKGRQGVHALLELEKYIKQEKEQTVNQSYLHPQILREKNRLLLAYQILRSYLILNESESDNKVDNSLFEKCVLFSKQNDTDRLVTENKANWNDEEQMIKLHNIGLCVVGLTKEIHSSLEKEFCIDIPFLKKSRAHDHKVVICDSNEKLLMLENMEKSHLILFVYCTDEYYSKIREMVGENVCVETDIIKTFKIAYIQEVLEQCYQFANKWDEFFIMAPITDNSTFAFQSQGIESFLEIKNSISNEKDLFSEDNGYVTNEFGVLTKVQEIRYEFEAEEKEKLLKIFYFAGDCIYSYQKEQNSFVPYKVLHDLDSIKKVVAKLRRNGKKKDVTRHKCNCQSMISYCLCDEWRTENPNVCELFMRFSVDMPLNEEQYCTFVWSGNTDEADRLGNFLFILSKNQIKSYSLRIQLDNLLNVQQNMNYVEYSNISMMDKQNETGIKELQKLLDDINAYETKNGKYWTKNSSDYNQMCLLRERIENSVQQGNAREYTDFVSEWELICKAIII